MRARSSNDKSNWSAWEDVINGANLRLTPSGRYLDVEVILERFSGTYLPVVYDLTIKNLDSNVLSADLGIKITGNASSLNPGETVKLTLQAVNNGPNTANVKVNYKIPFGLKLLSSQGQGNYDIDKGVWSIGNLQTGGSAALELVLQAVDAGSITSIALVYSDLNDLNTANNQVGLNLVVNALSSTPVADPLPYTFPPDIMPPSPYIPPQPPQPPVPPKPYIPPTPPLPPGPGPGPSEPKTQLQRDIASVRDIIAGVPGAKVADWTGDDKDEDKYTDNELNEWGSVLQKFGAEFLIFCAVSMIPDEYIKNLQTSFMNSMSTLSKIAEFFGQEKKIEKAVTLMKRAHSTVNAPNSLVWSKRIGAVLDGLGPNLGMKYLEAILKKLFPGLDGEIAMFLNAFSVAQFVLDPFGTLWSIIDAVSALFAKYIPKAEDINNILNIVI